MGFKRYDGTPIEIPTHKHSVEDTQIGGFTAYASYTNDGFIQKEDRVKLTSLKEKMDYLNDRLYSAVYLVEPKSSTLLSGSNFNTILKSTGPNATSVVFTNTAIPNDKISSASIVSNGDSDINAYMYLDGNTIYVSPEEDNTTIYANEDCNYMFNNCNSLTSLDLSNFDTSKVTSMGSMFRDCYYLTSLNVSNWSTTNVTNMNQMFQSCESLTSLDVSNFDTSNVTDMSWMFFNCNKLTSLDLSKWNTSNVIDMSVMFANTYSLSGSIIIMNPNTTNYDEMFINCSTEIGTKFIVNYKSGCQTMAQNMVNTKSSNSNVILGVQV